SCKYCSQPSGFCMVNSEGSGAGTPVASSGWDLFEGLTASPYCTGSQATNNRLGTVSAAAPLFVNADAGDYRLLAASPAIDTGDPASDAGLDFAGFPFPQRGTPGGTPRADIGAFEYQPPASVDGGPDGGDGGAPADGGPEADGGAGPLAAIEPGEQTVAAGELVHLDARGSRPSAGATLLRYRWSEPQGPTGLALEDAPQLSFTAREPGDYLVRLVVEDSSGASSAPATATVHVGGEVYSPPATLPGCGCGAGGAPGLALFALAVLRVLRRRARRPS
ncbi:MAG: PKD domain-containing protein, partial [Myxococcaceae bacterium]